MDNDVKRSGIFEIAMTNTSWKTVKIRRNTNIGPLKSCVQDEICTIHQIVTFDKPKDGPKPKLLKRICMLFQSEQNQAKLKLTH